MFARSSASLKKTLTAFGRKRSSQKVSQFRHWSSLISNSSATATVAVHVFSVSTTSMRLITVMSMRAFTLNR